MAHIFLVYSTDVKKVIFEKKNQHCHNPTLFDVTKVQNFDESE
jgi:hypothetical protein